MKGVIQLILVCALLAAIVSAETVASKVHKDKLQKDGAFTFNSVKLMQSRLKSWMQQGYKSNLLLHNQYQGQPFAFSASSSVAPGSHAVSSCLACTLMIAITSQRSLETSQSPIEIWTQFCDGVEIKVAKDFCIAVKDVLDIWLISVDPKLSPEENCQKISLCPNPLQCTLFPNWPPTSNQANPIKEQSKLFTTQNIRQFPRGLSDYPFWTDFSNLLQMVLEGSVKENTNDVFVKHIPMPSDDKDGDRFATASALRGASWRGRDCDDTKGDVYAGRNNSAYSASVDHNCNGIYGVDASGQSYEEKFCANSGQMGVAILGDSASAHFSLPPYVLSPQFFNNTNWSGFLHTVMNEADWPACSWSTAYETNENCPPQYAADTVLSIYNMMRARNRCNHRDFQNIGVNGGRTGNMAPPTGDIVALKRNAIDDQPSLVFYAPIGNDVCNGHPGFDHMTTPEEFTANVLAALNWLETTLPVGSHVVFMPLGDGLMLYDTLHNRTHPIGVQYSDLYEYLICMGLSPCEGWMNTNETMRNLTQAWANNLSALYPQIIANYSANYTHFDMVVLPHTLIQEVFQEWTASGKDPALLIEPSDGFHPSSTTNGLIAQYTWQWIQQNAPHFLGPINPYNTEIQDIFGDQGGY